MATDGKTDRQQSNVGLWVLAMVCVAVICFTLSAGIAYSGIRQAQQTAAQASLGHIEATFLLAERYAEDNGYGPPPDTYDNLLKSWDDAGSGNLTPQEKYVVDTMVDSFGSARSFDFAVARVSDGGSAVRQVYYFPVKGSNDARFDHYYLMSGDAVSEKNA